MAHTGDTIQFLQRVPLFQGLNNRQLKKLAERFVERRYAAGEAMVTQGQGGEGSSSSSLARPRRCGHAADGEKVVVNTFGPADFFGEMALLDDGVRTATVQATEPCDCLALTRWDFLGILKEDADMAVIILQEWRGVPDGAGSYASSFRRQGRVPRAAWPVADKCDMVKCPACGFDSPPEMKFCGQCGARLGVACRGLRVRQSGPLSLLRDVRPPAGRWSDLPDTIRSMTASARRRHCLQTPLAMTAGNGAITPLAGERRIATSLLADVRSSTDLMELLGTEAWVQLMNRVLQLLAAEVSRFGGRVDQFRGDGLVAFFGATDAHEDDPERAVLAGLAMHEAIRACADELKPQTQVDLKVRVGINTGEVIVASVGEAAVHREDTAMGGGVALAARMETAAEPGTVLVSEHTYRLIEGRFEWQPLGEITVKGIGRPVAVYRPLRGRTATDVLAAYDLTLPFTGRETAFAALTGCVEALCGGRGGIALVTGEKGMGKSLLTNRARQHFAQRTAICPDDARPRDRHRVPGRDLAVMHLPILRPGHPVCDVGRAAALLAGSRGRRRKPIRRPSCASKPRRCGAAHGGRALSAVSCHAAVAAGRRGPRRTDRASQG